LTAFGRQTGASLSSLRRLWFGLAIAKAIAYQHSGEIDVNSELGQELLSEFTCTSRSS